MELFKAHRQWATRPADERFPSIEALYDATYAYAKVAKEKNVPFSALRVEAVKDDVQLVGKAGVPAALTHWAFGQLSRLVGAPAEYLRELPATLACQNINHGLAHRVAEAVGSSTAALLFHTNGGLLLRSILTDRYSRIWNWEIADRLRDLKARGWEPAVPDTSWAPSAGIDLGPDAKKVTALYASDHDMFAFLRTNNYIREFGKDDPIWRGVIVSQSEVGAASLKLTRFLYRYMCGNHIIWGASKVEEISLRHVGDVRERWGTYAARLRKFAEESASDEEAKIKECKHKLIAATKEEVLDALFGKRVPLSRKLLEAGYDAVNVDQDGDPRTKWGIVQGLTRYSQTTPYADERTRIDRAAGNILDINF